MHIVCIARVSRRLVGLITFRVVPRCSIPEAPIAMVWSANCCASRTLTRRIVSACVSRIIKSATLLLAETTCAIVLLIVVVAIVPFAICMCATQHEKCHEG